MSTTRLIEPSTPHDGVRLITFNRPQKRNALSQDAINELLSELSSANKNLSIRVIVITGNGPLFSGMSKSSQ